MDFFGTPWDDLTLADVEAFINEQEDEGLTWETKGTEIRPASVLKAVGGLANQVGGFLIVGASREGERWTLDGVGFPDEPRVWLSNLISRPRMSPESSSGGRSRKEFGNRSNGFPANLCFATGRGPSMRFGTLAGT